MNKQRPIQCRSIPAQSLAGKAVLLEIGARLDLIDPLLTGRPVTAAEAAIQSNVREKFVDEYYAALLHAGLAMLDSTLSGEVAYIGATDLADSINDAGYILWGTMSCAPLIANARAFADDLQAASESFPRDGEHVGRTSKWIGEADFYPHAERTILAARPNRIVDLGSGTCGLLIRCLKQLKNTYGVGIDKNPHACAKARANIAEAGLTDRITVFETPIQNLLENPSPLVGADTIHAGFVLHDLVPEESGVLDALLRTIYRVAPNATLLIVDAVPYADAPQERAFSSLFTFLHSHFMGRHLMKEDEVCARLIRAGFGAVEVEPLGISGGRKYTARRAVLADP